VAIASRPRAAGTREAARFSAAPEQAQRRAKPAALAAQVGPAAVGQEQLLVARDEVVRRPEAGRAAALPQAVQRAVAQAGRAALPPEAARAGEGVQPRGVAARAEEAVQPMEVAAQAVAAEARRLAAARDGAALQRGAAVARAAVGARRPAEPGARAALRPALVWAFLRALLLCPARQPAARFARATARLSIASP
jgi:hypothetical protein